MNMQIRFAFSGHGMNGTCLTLILYKFIKFMISSRLDTIDFVGVSPSLRKALWVALATMHFHIAQYVLKKLILWKQRMHQMKLECASFLMFSIQGAPWNNMAPIQNCPLGARYVK